MRNLALRSKLNIFAGLNFLTMMDVAKETKKRGPRKIVTHIPPFPTSDISWAWLLIGKMMGFH